MTGWFHLPADTHDRQAPSMPVASALLHRGPSRLVGQPRRTRRSVLRTRVRIRRSNTENRLSTSAQGLNPRIISGFLNAPFEAEPRRRLFERLGTRRIVSRIANAPKIGTHRSVNCSRDAFRLWAR